jgi:type IV secretory pathway VirB4 component
MPSQVDDQYGRQIASIQDELMRLQTSARIVTNAEELEKLEHEIREITDRLAAALLGQKVQASLDSDEMSEAEAAMIEKHPKRMKSEGKKNSRRSHIIRM